VLKAYRFSLFLGIVILILSVISVRSVPKIDLKAADKIGHFLAYAALAFVVLFETALKFRWSIKYRRWLIYIIPICILFGVLMEFLQATPLFNRHFEYLDMVANSIGVMAGSILFLVAYRPLKKIYIK
jgi:VanZ family protein